MAEEGFPIHELLYPLLVDSKGRVKVKTNWYSAPLWPGLRVMASVGPLTVEIVHDNKVDAWSPAPSAYAVKARSAADAAAGVIFARENNLRLVIKGGGHSYLGTSNAPDSLLIWTRAMNKVVLHDAFVGRGCEGHISPVPAVSAEAGAVWMDLYNVVTTQGGPLRIRTPDFAAAA